MIAEAGLRPAIKFIRDNFGTDKFPLRDRYPIGVEVGVDTGQHAKQILKHLNWCYLWLVEINEKRKTAIEESLKSFSGKWKLFINSSAEQAKCAGNNLHFVYIDADHSYESVKSDIEAWWPKVMSGGVLCGHDYGNKTTPGVNQAVDEFVSKYGLKLTTDDIDWWVMK